MHVETTCSCDRVGKVDGHLQTLSADSIVRAITNMYCI